MPLSIFTPVYRSTLQLFNTNGAILPHVPLPSKEKGAAYRARRLEVDLLDENLAHLARECTEAEADVLYAASTTLGDQVVILN